MTLAQEDWKSLIRMLADTGDAKVAKVFFEGWLDEKVYRPALKEGWKDACDYYDIRDTFDWNDEEDLEDDREYWGGY